MDRLTEFKTELKTLLKKYDVSLGLTMDSCSDTYGITGEGIAISFNDDFHDRNRVVLVEGYWLNSGDL
jgi:hypothetical protein